MRPRRAVPSMARGVRVDGCLIEGARFRVYVRPRPLKTNRLNGVEHPRTLPTPRSVPSTPRVPPEVRRLIRGVSVREKRTAKILNPLLTYGRRI